MPVESLTLGNLRIEGVSRAGEATWIRVHPPGLAFDVGRGSVKLEGANDLFLSHGHLDHALGLPYVLSLRTLHHARLTRVFGPSRAIAALEDLIRAASALEGVDYRYELCGLEPGDRVAVGRDLQVEAFATDHVLPSLGFHLRRETRRLKSKYRGASSKELAALRSAGEEVETRDLEIWLSYCGDTGPGVFELEPRVFQAKVLLLECTFFDEGSRENASRYGHMHLQDLVTRADDFANRYLVLHHATRRHACAEVKRRLAEELRLATTEVRLFGCR